MGLRQGDAVSRRFDALRKKASQAGKQQEQEATGALQRRFASLGSLPSGAAIKAEQKVKSDIGKQREEAVQNVNIAEEGERGRLAEVKDARAFQTAERTAAQKSQQAFATGEREAGQAFGASQAEAQRGFASGEAEKQRSFQGSLAQKDLDFKNKVFSSESGFKREELDLANKQYEQDEFVTGFNMLTAAMESDDPAALKSALDRFNKITGAGIDTSALSNRGGSSFRQNAGDVGRTAAKGYGVGGILGGAIGGAGKLFGKLF